MAILPTFDTFETFTNASTKSQKSINKIEQSIKSSPHINEYKWLSDRYVEITQEAQKVMHVLSDDVAQQRVSAKQGKEVLASLNVFLDKIDTLTEQGINYVEILDGAADLHQKIKEIQHIAANLPPRSESAFTLQKFISAINSFFKNLFTIGNKNDDYSSHAEKMLDTASTNSWSTKDTASIRSWNSRNSNSFTSESTEQSSKEFNEYEPIDLDLNIVDEDVLKTSSNSTAQYKESISQIKNSEKSEPIELDLNIVDDDYGPAPK